MDILPIVGQTPEGVLMVGGTYKFFETHGVPLDVLFGLLKERNRMPSWVHFYLEARDAGMKHDRILSKLDHPIVDVYGVEMRDIVFQRLSDAFVCKGVIPNTFIACGEGNNYCSTNCQLKEKGHGLAR